MAEIKITLKKDCNNLKHTNVGRRLFDGSLICLDCKHEEIKKIMRTFN